jgi:hypothetical protein
LAGKFPSPTPVASHEDCDETVDDECLKDGEVCPKDKAGKTDADDQGKKFTCEADGDQAHWKAA